jgi:hypothetical protein
MDTVQVLALVVLVASGWFFWDSLRAREIANGAMRAACNAHGLLFLDDTVALRSVRPARDSEGRLRLRRTFDFAYSSSGFDRSAGFVVLVGNRVETLDLGMPQ